MTTIAIVGNRTGFTREYVYAVLDKVLVTKPEDKIISGGAMGVDTYAITWARKHNLITQVFFPDNSKPVPQRYFDRNEIIAQKADMVIAFNAKAHGSGTFHTITQATKLGKEVLEIGLNFPLEDAPVEAKYILE